MNQGSAELSDQVTILVFKDNFAARTFQIRPNWITKLGILLISIVTLAVLSTYFALKYYRVASKLDPTRILDLEQEISELKNHLKSQEIKGSSTSLGTQITSPASQVTAPPSDKTTPTTERPPNAAAMNENSSRIPLFLFPKGALGQLPDPSSLPFSLQAQKATWKGKTLKVNFAIQYDKKDEGHQQGKIIITARGPGTFLTYPSDALSSSESDHLIAPEKGEYFSVSHYREVSTDFGPVQSTNDLQEIEVFIFNQEGQILTYQKLLPQSDAPSKREKATSAIQPNTSNPSEEE